MRLPIEEELALMELRFISFVLSLIASFTHGPRVYIRNQEEREKKNLRKEKDMDNRKNEHDRGEIYAYSIQYCYASTSINILT